MENNPLCFGKSGYRTVEVKQSYLAQHSRPCLRTLGWVCLWAPASDGKTGGRCVCRQQYCNPNRKPK